MYVFSLYKVFKHEGGNSKTNWVKSAQRGIGGGFIFFVKNGGSGGREVLFGSIVSMYVYCI